MQLQAGKRVPEREVHSLTHVTAAGMWLERVIAEIRILEASPKNLTEGEDADDGFILDAANEQRPGIGLFASLQPALKLLCRDWRAHPALMKPLGRTAQPNDRVAIVDRRLPKVHSTPDLEPLRSAHRGPSGAERR
jgi:hypothetical protein